MASIWDAFYRSYTQKQAAETQKAQFAQQMAVQEAAQRLNESQFAFQRDVQYPEEVGARRTQEGFQREGLGLQREQMRQSGELGREANAINRGYLGRALAADSREQQMFDIRMPLIRQSIADQAEARNIMRSSYSDDPMALYQKALQTGNPAIIGAVTPIAMQRAAIGLSQSSKVGKFAQPQVLGIDIGEKFNVGEQPIRNVATSIATRLVGGMFGTDTRYTSEETNPEAKRLRGFLRGMSFQSSPIPTSPNQWDALIDYGEQMYSQPTGGQ